MVRDAADMLDSIAKDL